MATTDNLEISNEDMPAWLADYQKGTSFPRQDFFKARVVFYPGSGTDGEPVKIFGKTHSAHSFVYADYIFNDTVLKENLHDPIRGFNGYDILDICELQQSDLMEGGWKQHLSPDEIQHSMQRTQNSCRFGFLCILERKPEYDDSHGARRLAILFLGADGFATYDALFCQTESGRNPAFAVVVVDNGCNYNRFGRDGLMEQIAKHCDSFPEWLLVGAGTRPWTGYQPLIGTEEERRGDYPHSKSFYRRRHPQD